MITPEPEMAFYPKGLFTMLPITNLYLAAILTKFMIYYEGNDNSIIKNFKVVHVYSKNNPPTFFFNVEFTQFLHLNH